MDRNTLLLIIAMAAIGLVAILILFRPEMRLPASDIEVEDADSVNTIGVSPIPKEQRALPRPLVEFPSAAVNRPLMETPPDRRSTVASHTD